ncbi:MAG: hypothetical protein KatS3mg085_143 [Candidatus Dojkabacteria bacterium]|nr:MAG: hypothetical protein KatS3mg085_143 [Candidatus Dojkabacteria bacterium]
MKVKTNSKNCDEYVKIVNRLRGQLDGVLNMLEDERDPVEIVNQIKSIRSGLSSLAISILSNEASECFKKKNNGDKLKEVENLIKTFFSIK